MAIEPETLQKSNAIPLGRRKFLAKITMMKKDKSKRNPQKKANIVKSKAEDPLDRLHQEIESNLKEVHQHKTKIERLTKSAIAELTKLQSLSQKVNNLQKKNTSTNKTGQSETRSGSETKISKNNNNQKFELDYELTNLKMIKKILDLSKSFEAEEFEQKKKTNTRKRRTKPKGKEKLKAKGQKNDGRKKILIVEDDSTTIKIIRHILEQNNFQVGYSMSGEEGLMKAFKEKPDLILLDIMLPGMDGFQLLTKLKANKETFRTPVIILSSLSAEKDVLKGLERGASDYILKPFSPQILLIKIKIILSFKNEHLTYYRHL